jgi:hypothetical protein
VQADEDKSAALWIFEVYWCDWMVRTKVAFSPATSANDNRVASRQGIQLQTTNEFHKYKSKHPPDWAGEGAVDDLSMRSKAG